jgi:5'-nucleotidase
MSTKLRTHQNCYTEKRIWIEKYFGFGFTYRLILSCHKNLLMGDYLIDDYESGRWQEGFEGTLVVFGSEKFPDWNKVMKYLSPKP